VSQVTNYTVENAAGNVVRADINSILDAVKTNNSGGSDPSNPVKFMLYGKSSDDKLKVYDGSNFREIGDVGEDNLGLLLRSGGTMTGPVLADDASGASTPAIAFDGDADTGLFRKAANTLGFSTAGTERAIVDSNGLTIQAQGDIRLADSDSSNFVALQAPSTVGSNLTFTLPSADGSNGQFLQTNGSGALSFSTVQGVPSGAVFCIAVATVPSDYLECNGAAVSRTTYSALFAVIGTAYGAGNGSSTFNVPDLRGEFIRGFDNGKGTDSGRSIATAQSGQNVAHTHGPGSYQTDVDAASGNITGISETFNSNGSCSGVFSKSTGHHQGGTPSQHSDHGDCGRASFSHSHNHTINTGVSGSDGGTESRPRNIAMMYVIKT
tara:strand:+ start:1092 stop:2231 length:1140 start_codon:yes stop_codon:yes gene_type:complete